jgi:hypothetical protein
MPPHIPEGLFTWLSLVGNTVPPRDPPNTDDDDDNDDDEDNDGEADDDREPPVIREPEEDE